MFLHNHHRKQNNIFLQEISQRPTNFREVFNNNCVEAFEILKKALISAPIVQPPDWNLPFQIMCDASNYVVGAVLGQRVDKKLNVIQYASKTLDNAQRNYATTKKEFLQLYLLVISSDLILLILK